jgi:hypothetical protein
VVGVAGFGWVALQQENEPVVRVDSSSPRLGQSQRGNPPPQQEPEPVPPKIVSLNLVRDGDYYAHLKLVELRPQKPDGDSWDGNDGTPDINVKLFWNNTLLHESATRDDVLIAEWDLLRLDVRDALLSGEVDIGTAVAAPLVRAEEGGVLRIEVWDDDVSFSDRAGRFDLPLVSLKEGVNRFTFDEGGVARLVLDMVPRNIDLPDLLERASDR